MANEGQENVPPSSSQDFPPSSPLVPVSSIRRNSTKPKKPPPVTPRRFNRFFSPRSDRLNSSSARALKDVTAKAANRLGPVSFDDIDQDRRAKRRRLSIDTVTDIPSSPPCSSTAQSSPIRASRPKVENVFPVRIRRSQVHERWQATYAPDFRSISSHYPDRTPFSIAACHTNPVVATGHEDGRVVISDTSASSSTPFSKPFLSFRPHCNAVMDMAFSEDDAYLATGSGDQSAQVIDMRTQRTVHNLSGHTASVKQVAFQPGSGGTVVIAAARNGKVGWWDVRCPPHRPQAQVSTSASDAEDDRDATMIPMASSISLSSPSKVLTSVPTGNRSSSPFTTSSSSGGNTRAAPRNPSVTSLLFLPSSPHLFLTSSDSSARLSVWDIRARHSPRSSAPPRPLSTTAALPHHLAHRHYGITSLSLSPRGDRVYALCKDHLLYTYSTQHLYLGQDPRSPRITGLTGSGPLHAYSAASLGVSIGSFYVRCSAGYTATGDEVIACGGVGGPGVIPAGEEFLRGRRVVRWLGAGRGGGGGGGGDGGGGGGGGGATATGGEATAALEPAQERIPVYHVGSRLGGHSNEVTGVSWAHGGGLVSISDDWTARLWREDADKARRLRRDKGVEKLEQNESGDVWAWGDDVCGGGGDDDDWDEEDG